MTIKNTFFLLLCLFLGLSNTFLETPPAPTNTKGIIDLGNLFNYANQYIPEKAILNNNETNPITDLGATLGRVLFYDKKLSLNGTTACASCHQQENAFGDTRKVSIGFDGKPTERHAMRLINVDFAADNFRFWDKRATNLEGTVTLPFQNEIEMGFSGTNGQPTMDSLLSKMKTIPYYPSLFNAVFGDEQITEKRMQLALAQFIRSILSYDAKFDEGYEQVDNELVPFPNFTEEENEGKRLFFTFPPRNGPQTDRTGAFCGVCHKVPSFSILHLSLNNGVIGVAGDTSAVDLSVIRSPSIRDLVKADGSSNGPFMHDGSLDSLAAIIDHYNDIPANPANTNFSGLLFPNGANEVKLNLTDDHKAALVAFLKTLSGNDVYVNEKWANPFNESEDLQVVLEDDCPTIQSSLAVTLCAGDQYKGLSQSGVYTNIFTTSSGCDSIETLTLEVLPLTNTSLEQTICAGESFLGYAASGTFVDTINNPTGCKEIRTLTLDVLPFNTAFLEQTICAGESFLGYATTGTFVDTFENLVGCDTLRTLALTVLDAADASCLPTSLIDQQFAPGVTAFPNPFNDEIYFQNLPIANYEWRMTNTMGALIEQGQISRKTEAFIRLSTATPGVYFIQLSQTNTAQVYVFKLLKQ